MKTTLKTLLILTLSIIASTCGNPDSIEIQSEPSDLHQYVYGDDPMLSAWVSEIQQSNQGRYSGLLNEINLSNAVKRQDSLGNIIYAIHIDSSDPLSLVNLWLYEIDDQIVGRVIQRKIDRLWLEASGFTGWHEFTGYMIVFDLDGNTLYETRIIDGHSKSERVSNGRSSGYICTTKTVEICGGYGTNQPEAEANTDCFYDVVTTCTWFNSGTATTNTPSSGAFIGTTSEPRRIADYELTDALDCGDGYVFDKEKGCTPGCDRGMVLNTSGTSCITLKESLESRIESEQNSEEKRKLQLEYLESFGGSDGKEFSAFVKELLNTSGLTVGDVQEVNNLVDTMYLGLKAQYIAAIFSPDNVGTILALGFNVNASNTLKNSFFKTLPRYFSKSGIGQGFASFDLFKKANGAAGTGKAWHHIVSQRASNITRFGSDKIHNTKNLVRLPHGKGTWHQRITNFYNRINPNGIDTEGLRFGEWVAKKSFEEQLEWGLKIMSWME